MDDSFRVRVEKAFGSLEASSASSMAVVHEDSSLWCLTDNEIERKEWKRETGFAEDALLPHSGRNLFPHVNSSRLPSSSSSELGRDDEKLLASELQELNEDDNYENDERGSGKSDERIGEKPDDHNDEEWDIRTSVGLDCTLDYEDEEDAYDKVAIGKEDTGDRMYMRDVTEYEADIDCRSAYPSTFRNFKKDPRADLMAANIRLKEDAEAAKDFHAQFPFIDLPSFVGAQTKKSEEEVDLKSILKRKEHQMGKKSKKRVRFEDVSKDVTEQDPVQTKNLMVEESLASNLSYRSGVPDYIRNPSKYTHYTFDSASEIDEESNQRAYIDCFTLMKGPRMKEICDSISTSPPKSVTFTPKNKPGKSLAKDVECRNMKNNEFFDKKCLPLGIAAGESQYGEICPMEEDEQPTRLGGAICLQKESRRYRTKGSVDYDELVS